MTLDQVKKLIKDQKLEFFLCSFVEMGGLPKAKLVPATHVEDMAAEGAGFAGFAAGEMNQGPHDPEMANIPDFGSLTQVPWRPNMAWVAGNITVEDEPYPYCPRTILQRQLDRAAEKGFTFHVGVEAEFMLLRRGEDGSCAPYDPLDVLDKPCYDLVTLHRNSRHDDHPHRLHAGPGAGGPTPTTTKTPTASSRSTGSTPTPWPPPTATPSSAGWSRPWRRTMVCWPPSCPNPFPI